MCICDPMLGVLCATHAELVNRVRWGGFDATARAAGWVPLADVLDALRDHDGFVDWTRTKGPRGYIDDYVVCQYREACARYLAERFAPTTASEGDHAG
jgi:hypothetical protein